MKLKSMYVLLFKCLLHRVTYLVDSCCPDWWRLFTVPKEVLEFHIGNMSILSWEISEVIVREAFSIQISIILPPDCKW
jgi:hypothetical protein